MSNVLVSDANVFVFLIKANVFEKVFHGSLFTVYVTEAVVEEITQGNVIPRRHYNVTDRFNKALYSQYPSEDVVDIQLKSIDEVTSDTGIQYYSDLKDENLLDKGELESVVIAKEFNIRFISDDDDSIDECDDQQIPHAHFLVFVDECKTQEIINEEEYSLLLDVIKS